MKKIVAFILLLNQFTAWSQIIIDGQFADWDFINHIDDSIGDQQYFDLIRTHVHSDQDYIYFSIEGETFWQLNSEYSILLHMDIDANSNTGLPISDIGADLTWSFAGRNGTWNGQTVYHDQIGLFTAPTVTSNRFEIAFRRSTLSPSDTIRFIWQSMNGTDDQLPDQGHISHVLQNNNYPYTPIDIQKSSPTHLRVMTYNVEHDGLMHGIFGPRITQIIEAINPDIITFNELWDTPASTVKSILDTLLPQAGGWFTAKLFSGNVTASRYPISWNESINPEDRMLISNIQLGAPWSSPIFIANLHLKCCDDDERRQDQVDDFVHFYRDLKDSASGILWGTPFIVMGDMNFVGDYRQLRTILQGDVVQESIYGPDEAPDWDGTPIKACMPHLNDSRDIYTWPGTGSSYYPGKLDYIFYSDYSLQLEKSFVYHTDPAPLASDHLPVVADFSINPNLSSIELEQNPKFRIAALHGQNSIKLTSLSEPLHEVEVYSNSGKRIFTNQHLPGAMEVVIPTSTSTPVLYLFIINQKHTFKSMVVDKK